MPTQPPLHPDVSLNLALAVVASSSAPLVLLDGGSRVIAASTSFCRAFQLDTGLVNGQEIFELGEGEWDMPKLRSFLSTVVSGFADIEAYEIDLKSQRQGTRRLVLNAKQLDYGDKANVRLLLSISDVTDARIAEKLKDDLLKEKAVLLQEIQHRVANSLQIIASVLMQSAKRVQSEETRGHLHDAHNRVMSIASVQQQLASSHVGEVGLRSYFEQLCNSLGASMISDHKQLTLDVAVDDSVVKADTSISLGLIVTELVINALKHAFPDHREGKIKVDYRSKDDDWTLFVSDNGVGMHPSSDGKAGLGTSIVEALTRQLGAGIHVSDANPGTTISIIHTHVEAMARDPRVLPFHRPV